VPRSVETELISNQQRSCPGAPTSPVGNSSCDWLGKCQALQQGSMATVDKTPDMGREPGLRETRANTGARVTGIRMTRYPANEVDRLDPNGLRGRFGQEKSEGRALIAFPLPASLVSVLDVLCSYKFNDPEAIEKWANAIRSSTRVEVGRCR
jgi:hypothetical protein